MIIDVVCRALSRTQAGSRTYWPRGGVWSARRGPERHEGGWAGCLPWLAASMASDAAGRGPSFRRRVAGALTWVDGQGPV
jgi:hypothetical protein